MAAASAVFTADALCPAGRFRTCARTLWGGFALCMSASAVEAVFFTDVELGTELCGRRRRTSETFSSFASIANDATPTTIPIPATVSFTLFDFAHSARRCVVVHTSASLDISRAGIVSRVKQAIFILLKLSLLIWRICPYVLLAFKTVLDKCFPGSHVRTVRIIDSHSAIRR